MSQKVFYGLPKKVLFCKKSLMSNQRPNSVAEFLSKRNSLKQTIGFNNKGISESYLIHFRKRKLIIKEEKNYLNF